MNYAELHLAASNLVETARQQWAEHHRLNPLCQKAFEEARRLQAACEGAHQAARNAEGELSSPLQCAALDANREKPPIEHPETARPALTQALGDAFQRGQDGYTPKSNDEGK